MNRAAKRLALMVDANEADIYAALKGNRSTAFLAETIRNLVNDATFDDADREDFTDWCPRELAGRGTELTSAGQCTNTGTQVPWDRWPTDPGNTFGMAHCDACGRSTAPIEFKDRDVWRYRAHGTVSSFADVVTRTWNDNREV